MQSKLLGKPEEAVAKLETRHVSEDCTEYSSTSLTRRVTILAFGSVRLKKSQPRSVRAADLVSRDASAAGFPRYTRTYVRRLTRCSRVFD